MRPEVSAWLRQAEYDLETAEYNYKGGRLSVAAFFCQQAVEKTLKGLFIYKQKESPGPTHSLVYLGRKCGIPRSMLRFLKELSTEFLTSRYPDVTGELPFTLYDEATIQEYLEKSREVLAWASSQIKS